METAYSYVFLQCSECIKKGMPVTLSVVQILKDIC